VANAIVFAHASDRISGRASWALALPMLGSKLAGWEPGLDAAMALIAVQAVLAVRRCGRLEAMAVQVRLVYLLLLIAGSAPALGLVHLLQFAAAAVNAAFGYCLLGRALSLLPWNREAPISASLLETTFLGPARFECPGRTAA
jgi:hypothetical protein